MSSNVNDDLSSSSSSESTKTQIVDKNVAPNESLPTAAVLATLENLLLARYPNQSYSYKLSTAAAKGDNYMGVVYRIIVDISVSKEQFTLIVKVPPQNVIRRKQFFARPCFLREIKAYNEFLPLVVKFEREHNVPASECFQQFAKSYCCISDDLNEAIFLEDLCASNFKLHDRFEVLQKQHVTIILRAYAKLHAISFAIKQHQPQRLNDFQNMVDIFVMRRDDVSLGDYFEQLKGPALETLDTVDDSKYIERLRKYFESATTFDLLIDALDSKNCEPYAVVTHGDCWNNNFMFRYEQGVAVDVRLIDWQLLRYASPMIDLAYFIYLCTNKEFRDRHLDEMLNYYYAELVAQLKRLGSDAQVLFPHDAFLKQVKCKFVSGLLFAMILLPLVTLNSEEVPDLEQLSETIEAGGNFELKDTGFLSAKNESAYKRRMREVIIDMVERDYI